MSKPRYQRRKQDRPQEITEAAIEAFAEKGYAATRVDDVAKRAGISKGLMYLYFKTKEELFRAVVRTVIAPKIDKLSSELAHSTDSAESFLRGPFLTQAKALPGSRVAVILRLMIAEGPRHPDLVKFYWDNVASRGIETLTAVIDRGVANGEFKPVDVRHVPHMLVMPVLFSIIFKLVFDKQSLQTDALIEDQLNLVIRQLKSGDWQ